MFMGLKNHIKSQKSMILVILGFKNLDFPFWGRKEGGILGVGRYILNKSPP